ncbi:MAG: hypothetical protein KDD82_09180 [Planctomycetes bacterium]|nr:hypothetical protein [Planctomycetota bacterium]
MNVLSSFTLRCVCLASLTLSLGLSASGCGGGSGRSSSTAPGSTAGGATASSLPAPSRAASYSYTSVSAGTNPDDAIDGLSIAANGSDLLAISASRALLVGGQAIEEAQLGATTTSVASTGSEAFLGTADGAGDLYQRTEANGVGTWTLVNDTPFDELHVATVAGAPVALLGGAGLAGELWTLDAAGQATSTADLGSSVPTAAVGFLGSTWVGVTDAGSLQVGLRKVSGAAVEALAVPGAAPGPNFSQSVTDMLVVTDARGAELLVFSVATFDLVGGAPISGSVLSTADGLSFDTLVSFTQDAPTCLAWQDSTLYAGLASGRLVYRDANGGWPDEIGLPPTTGIFSLFSKDASTLMIGARDASGPLVLARLGAAATAGSATPGAGTAPPPPANGVYDYLNSLKPALSSCVACHSTMQTGYTLSAGLADDMADYQATLAQVDVNAPASSNLLQKGSATVAHAGGGLWPVGSATYDLVLAWISGGAVYDGGAAAQGPPPLSANPTYLVDAKPVIASCSGCHTNDDDFRLSAGLANDTRDYQTVINEVNLGDPANSSLLRRAVGRGHPVKVFDVGSQPYDTLLNWIQKGAPFQ